MSTFYLLDMHVPDIADSRIVDVVTTSDSEIRVDGLVPIKIPDGVRVESPASLNDLLTQKYAGILALYPGFGNVMYDALLDSDGLEPPNLSQSNISRKLGARGNVAGNVKTSASDPSLDFAGPVDQCVVVFEAYTWRYVDRRDARFERHYVDQDSGAWSVSISLNGGQDSVFSTSGALVSFDFVGGTPRLQLEFSDSRPDATPYSLLHYGSWAVLF